MRAMRRSRTNIASMRLRIACSISTISSIVPDDAGSLDKSGKQADTVLQDDFAGFLSINKVSRQY
jgi:hypothetical protein